MYATQTENSQVPYGYWLHYIGARLYDLSLFRIEAERLGVQRAVPYHMLRNFEFGTPVLLAVRIKPKGAHIFGYFVVDGISTTLPSDVLTLALGKDLNVGDIDNKPKTVNRACGTYTVERTFKINMSLAQLLDQINEACWLAGIDPKKYKWFLTGTFCEITPMFVDAPFTRSYVWVQVPEILGAIGDDTATVHQLSNYMRRKTLSKKERGALLSYSLCGDV